MKDHPRPVFLCLTFALSLILSHGALCSEDDPYSTSETEKEEPAETGNVFLDLPLLSIPIIRNSQCVATYQLLMQVETDDEFSLIVREKLPVLVDKIFSDLYRSLPIGEVAKLPRSVYHERVQKISDELFGAGKAHLYLKRFHRHTQADEEV